MLWIKNADSTLSLSLANVVTIEGVDSDEVTLTMVSGKSYSVIGANIARDIENGLPAGRGATIEELP